MQRRPAPLLPILRSPHQGELLAWLFLHPENEYTTSDLAGKLGVSQSTVSREADRLAAGDLITERRIGNLRLLRANMESQAARPLADLLAVTYGPLAVLPQLLAPIKGVQEAYIFGSWAARYEGEPGPQPHDVDVLVVGTPDRNDIWDAADDAQRVLRREVNTQEVTPQQWAAAADGSGSTFLEHIRSRPLVRLPLEAYR